MDSIEYLKSKIFEFENQIKGLQEEFKSTNDNVYIGVTTSFLEDAKYNLQVNVYDPFGNLICKAKWDNQDQKKGSSWNYWYKIFFENYLVGAIPGVWKAKVP